MYQWGFIPFNWKEYIRHLLSSKYISVSPPHTKCEREKAETGRKQLVAADTFVPHCNPFNGLYLDIQIQPSGWKWCVDAFEGSPINGTETPPGASPPTCPGNEIFHYLHRLHSRAFTFNTTS